MISRLPRGLKHTLMYGFSIALMKGVSLIMLPIFTYFLTADDFGRLEIISSLAVIGSVLVGMGQYPLKQISLKSYVYIPKQ